MGGMAQGLFASLLIGTIIGTVGGYIPWAPLKDFFLMVAAVCKANYVVGAAIGIGTMNSYKLINVKVNLMVCIGSLLMAKNLIAILGVFNS